MVSAFPPDVKIRKVGVITCSPPTKKFSGAAARASTRPSSINPLTIRTAPTYRSPTLLMSLIPPVALENPCPEGFVAGLSRAYGQITGLAVDAGPDCLLPPLRHLHGAVEQR